MAESSTALGMRSHPFDAVSGVGQSALQKGGLGTGSVVVRSCGNETVSFRNDSSDGEHPGGIQFTLTWIWISIQQKKEGFKTFFF